MKKHVRVLQISISAVVVLSSTVAAFGKSAFTSSGSCGLAKVVSGDTCSNVKVEFKFDGCELQSEPQIATKIICDKQTIKARFQEGNLRYEAQFEKSDDGWGGINWKQLSGVVQFKKQTVAMEKVAAPRAPRTPAAEEPKKITATIPAVAAPTDATPIATTPAGNFKFGGFADVRYTNFWTKDNPTIASGVPESGFGIEDGAFYGNYDKENLSVVLDVAFRRSKDVDINSAATKPNQSSNGNFAIGYDKSQLYLKYKLGSMFVVDFGQFDTIYGVELNDSKDRIFGKTGIVYDNTLPVTHTGLMVELLTNGFYAKTFIANPNNKGSYGSSAAGDDRSEYGTALGYSNEYIRGQAGYMARPIFKASGMGSADRSLIDLIIGTTLGSFSLDLEYSRVSDPNKNTITPADTGNFEEAGQGMLALASYKITDAFLVGVRYEQIKDDPAALSIKSINSFGGSIHYRVSPELELRTEYMTYDSKNLTDVSWKDTRSNFAALLLF